MTNGQDAGRGKDGEAGAVRIEDFFSSPDTVDVPEALNRLRGNRRLLLKLLLDFRESQAGTMAEIRRRVEAGEDAKARNLLHTLKGVASNLSARGVETVAADLGAAIREGKETRKREALVELEAAFGVVSAAVEKMQAAQAAKPAHSSAPPEIGEDRRGELAEALPRLAELLGESNIEAEFYLESVSPLLSAAFPEADIDELARSISRLDFKTAAEKLSRMASSAGVDLSGSRGGV